MQEAYSDRDVLRIDVIDSLILTKMKEDFFALLGVDMDTGRTRILKQPSWYNIGDERELLSFTEVFQSFAEHYEGETREFFLRNSDLKSLRQAFASEDRSTFPYKSRFVDGGKWVNCIGRVLSRHPGGTPKLFSVGFSILDSNAVEKENLRQQLSEALNSAEVANKAKSDFMFNMSHDIRTPLNVIMGYTAMAKKYADDSERVSEYLSKIDLSGQQLLSIINQVLEMARIESGKIELDEKSHNIKEQFMSMVAVLSAQATISGIEFNYSLGNIEHVNVFDDAPRLSQIALNVAGNAFKYTPEGGRVDFLLKELPCSRDNYATYVLTVKDTGIGMSSEYLDKLFEPFSRENNSTVSRIQGTGLGMAIVKNIVDLLGGSIKVESKQGQGTSFDISVDLKIDNTVEKKSSDDESKKDMSFEGYRILLVEDNEMNREIARRMLQAHDFTVEEAEDGDIAVKMVSETAARNDYGYYNFILMDVQMPNMNGYDATRAIREIHSHGNVHVPIIALTANAFEEDRKNAFEAGMDEHLSKPIDVNKLFETLAKFA